MVLEGLTHARVAPLLRTKPSRGPCSLVSETLRKGSRSNIFAKRRKNWSKCYILAMFGGSLRIFLVAAPNSPKDTVLTVLAWPPLQVQTMASDAMRLPQCAFSRKKRCTVDLSKSNGPVWELDTIAGS